MKNQSPIDQQAQLFGEIFLLSNRLQIIGDSYLKEITTKQWFLMVIIERFGEYHPTLSEVAKELGSSRQNLKQIALKLQNKGYLTIEKDTKDSRVLRLSLTKKSGQFWAGREEQDKEFIKSLFSGVSANEIEVMLRGFSQVFGNIHKIGEKYSE